MFLKNDLENINLKLIDGLSIIYSKNEASSIAKLLLEHIGFSHLDIVTSKTQTLSEKQIEFLEKSLVRLQNHEPVQYILGKAHFYGMELYVNHAVLIPRQETEELVSLIISENEKLQPHVLDVGTGCGCIALSLKKNILASHLDAIDISKNAIEVALKNAENQDLNIHFHIIDILHEAYLPDNYDIIVSNPPYVTESEIPDIMKNVMDFEPREALFVPNNSPLIFYECIIELAILHLHPEGKIYFEINEKLGHDVKTLLSEAGFQNIKIIKDLNGRERFATAVRSD